MQRFVGCVVECKGSCVGSGISELSYIETIPLVRDSQIAKQRLGDRKDAQVAKCQLAPPSRLQLRHQTFATELICLPLPFHHTHLAHLHPTSPLLLEMADTDTDDISDRQFTRQLEAAIKLYNADILEECEQVTKKLVNHHAIPLYHRTKAPCILASIVEDDDEAWSYYSEAEALWRMVKRASDNGDIKDVDESLAEIREELDELKRELNSGDDWTEENQADADKEDVAAAGAHDDEFMDLEDEANALGIITNEMRKVILDQSDLGAGDHPAGTYIHGWKTET
jgi:hypothetical protein